MDFRDKNPNLFVWPMDALNRLISTFPYECMGKGALYSLPAFDNSTSFMLHLGSLDLDEFTSCAHAVEAPLNSKVRQDFERGKMSWTDFWSHSGWVIEFSLLLYSDEPAKARYLPFRDLSPVFLKELGELDVLGSPYKIYHDTLIRHCAFETKYWPNQTEHRDNYQDFVLKYRGFLDETCIIRKEFLEFELGAIEKGSLNQAS